MRTFFRLLIVVLLVPIQVAANSAGKPFEDLQTHHLSTFETPMGHKIDIVSTVLQSVAHWKAFGIHFWMNFGLLPPSKPQ